MTKKQAVKVLKLNKLDNLLLNISGGLRPEDFNKSEVKLLERKYGKN